MKKLLSLLMLLCLALTVAPAARRGIEPTLNALSALMFVALLVLLLIVNRRTASNND